LENFSEAVNHSACRRDPPPVIASTLLVPGYLDADEVGRIARFIADINPAIPYVLLGFAPQFLFPDLPRTSVRHAEEAESVAHRARGQSSLAFSRLIEPCWLLGSSNQIPSDIHGWYK
jgi:pyruvate formate lyase activating enzyme